MEEETPPPPKAPLTASLEEMVTALGHTVRRELRRTLLGVMLGVLSFILLLVVALGFVVAGLMRLGDALGHLCGRWFGDQALGDATVGIALVGLPLISVLLLRLWVWKK